MLEGVIAITKVGYQKEENMLGIVSSTAKNGVLIGKKLCTLVQLNTNLCVISMYLLLNNNKNEGD